MNNPNMDEDQDILDEITKLRNKLYVIEMEQKVNIIRVEKLERLQKEISVKSNKSEVGYECNYSFD